MAQELMRLEQVTRRITSEFYIRNIDLTINKGEVLALAGKNAAGKSTLASVINGFLPADSGRIYFEGRPVKISEPAVATKLSIVTLMQNNQGFEQMSVADNILFGNDQYYKTGRMSPRRLCAVCSECFETLGIDIDPSKPFYTLTSAQKQAAAIARAYLSDAKLIIMDEPSSHLPHKECSVLYDMVHALRKTGVSILYITHRLDEIIALADRVVFVERGELKEVRETAGMTELDLIEAIEGFQVSDIYSKQQLELGEPVLEVASISAGHAKDISFTLHKSEIIALVSDSGLCAQSVYRMLAGLLEYTGGIKVAGREVRIDNPITADALRIVSAIDEDTEEQLQNYDSDGGRKAGKLALLSAKMRDTINAMGKMLHNVVGVNTQRKEYMTGGYRQRELVQRALAKDGDIFVLVDPTNGVDLQTKLRIYNEIAGQAKRGRGILYFTNDVNEAIGLADRILVLGRNTIVFDKSAKETDADTLTKLLKG
ncbi:ATP-binding cassette domain-containing protein [Hydrogenoanaerobacterium sp.]|uniref:ATP-binding cassette domain-containing protein n=1 Tax=Hydrogenoanaerobacterium sp. TaxID=2953763 RepID=UPI00289B2324|nr:ATP-binding cassette domain-containing protein [Hydrogenoanaerobacterium sp.]